MRKVLIPLASIAILTLGIAHLLPHQETNSNSFKIDHLFFAQGSYIFIHPPQQIAAGSISSPQPSFDSRFIAYLSDPVANQSASYTPVTESYNEAIDPGPRRSAYLYDLKSGQTTQILNLEGKSIKPTKFYWLPYSPYLYIEFQRDQKIVRCLIDSSTLAKTFLPPTTGSDSSDVTLFLAATNEVVTIQPNGKQDSCLLTLTNIDSGANRTVKVPGTVFYGFETDGKNLFVNGETYYSPDDPTSDIRYYQVDLSSGKLTPGKMNLDLAVETYYVQQSGSDCTISGEYLDNPGEPKFADFEAVLSPEAINGGATLDRQFAYYYNRSGLFLSRLQPFNENQLAQMFAPAMKAKAINAAKQVGTATMIYCSDYDDRFPLANNFKDGVMPYIKNGSLFIGFQYLMDGELATEIDSITTKHLGIIQTPFGTAIVYADSSVKWRNWDDPPSKVQF